MERTWLCNQERKDIKSYLLKELKKDPQEIFFSIYALNDKDLVNALNQRAKLGSKICIWTDQKHAPSLKKQLFESIELLKREQKGLMHHKILIIDDHCLLGSTNLTPTSLRMHDNLMVDIHSPPLAYALKKMLTLYPSGSQFTSQELDLYLLPHPLALKSILNEIYLAQKEVQVAFFTFTHLEIANALIQAKERGVKVKVLIDALSIQGASKNVAHLLQKNGVCVYVNPGLQLMHHKMCFIDDKTLLFGSCNWTKSALKKNNDFIVHLKKMPPHEKKWIKKLFRHLFWESKPLKTRR